MGDNTRVDLGLRVGMLRGHPRMARGFGAPRGRRVVHRDSNPRMARGFGAPRGRRVGKAVEWPSNTTIKQFIFPSQLNINNSENEIIKQFN